ANHPFWSADRQDFVPAGALTIGEHLRTESGTLRQVTRITPRRGPPVAVFNLEVDAEHVYFVSTAGVLVHNAYPGGVPGKGVVAQIGHATPWAQMTAAQRKAFQHSYSRHAQELGLPAWSQKNAEALRTQFNSIVGYILQSGTKISNPPKKPFNGQSVDIEFYEAWLNGTKYYYYETLDGIFISAGKAR
ncbi:MAG: polymorphic toxin-type HINT domain-containing protein, partial [Planctomycetaceae bacterium]